MLFRRLLLALGSLALIAGVALAVLWLRSAPTVVVEQPTVQRTAVLVAARTLAPGSLLRADDVRWSEVAVSDVPPGTFVRGQALEGTVLGSATRRAFRLGEALLADQLIGPTDPGFLPAVLGRGMRATSIAVDPAEGGSGLIAPGDHVDVLLTQTFTDTAIDTSSRTVGETVLHDLRVIAIDQTLANPDKSHPAPVSESRLPKTITLEVSARQAEVLMVASQLGKLQLTLRSLVDTADGIGSLEAPPTWAFEVSPALRSLSPATRPGSVKGASPATPSVSIESIQIIRGSKSESVCYSGTTGAATTCATAPQGTVPGPTGAAEPGLLPAAAASPGPAQSPQAPKPRS